MHVSIDLTNIIEVTIECEAYLVNLDSPDELRLTYR